MAVFPASKRDIFLVEIFKSEDVLLCIGGQENRELSSHRSQDDYCDVQFFKYAISIHKLWPFKLVKYTSVNSYEMIEMMHTAWQEK